LKVAYIHYHLKPGGVSAVIRHQVQSLAPGTEAVVLCGEKPPSPFPVPVLTVPGLGYAGTPGTDQAADKIAANIHRAIDRHFGGSGTCDLLHIHNPTLAKNRQFPEIIQCLQRLGYPLLLQIHDLAEDGRPSIYFHDQAYPRDCHYSVINRRDYSILRKSGLTDAGLHYLPNAVLPPVKVPSVTNGDDFILFPVRAIRRKNIGEALLLSLFLPSNCQLFITLPPNSPADWASYSHWQRLVQKRCLPVRFEMGLKIDFATLLQQSRHVISTSISEGFGFAFLEPWVAGKNMEGRMLVDICRDFIEAGLDLGHLYPQIKVPVDWIGRDRLLQRFQDCYNRNCQLFGFSSRMPPAEDFTAPLQNTDTVDFGLLDEPLQTMLIQSIQSRTTRSEHLKALNPALLRMGRKPRSTERINANREIAIETYGLNAYGRRLRHIQQTALQHPVQQGIDKFELFKAYANLNNFSLLKWNTYSDRM
jgi:hypothetical protein